MDKRTYIWRFFLALLLFGTSALGYSQDAPAEEDTEPSELHLFRGGFLDLNFGINMNTLGGSLGSSGMGGLITTQVYNGALNVDLNPAMLAFNHSGHMVVNSRFGLGTAMNSGLNKRFLNSLNASFDRRGGWVAFEFSQTP